MNLITVIPIARAIGHETLTYFSATLPEKGSVVEIPLRGRKIFGIVVSAELAENKKSEIKSLSYGIKKIDKVKSKSFLLPQFIEGAQAISDYYATSTGAVLSALLPKTILESIDDLSSQRAVEKKHTGRAEILALQSSDDERYSAYKSFIREEFAKKGSVYVCLPTREEIKTAEETLQKGIEPYTFVLHNGMSRKEVVATWNKMLETTHPILIIGNGYFLSVPRADIKAVIVENESSRAYGIPKRPFLDIRTVVEILSKKMGWKAVFGDKALRVETVFREKENEIAEFSPLKYRVLSSAETTISDARTPKNQIKKEFSIIGPDIARLIEETKKENDHLFLFCARKGLAPLTVCADCGETVSCRNCGAPTILYGGKDKNGKTANFFRCQKCGEKQIAEILCVRCGSWKLSPLGISIESAEQELKKKFPESTIFIMDKDHIKTHKQAESISKKFYDIPGSILLGTEMALPYVREKIGSAAVVSLDSFFNIPDFRINEKIMNIILSLRALASKKMIVQTRRPEESIFEYALKGNLADFYREEIEQRKQFGYPPFNTFIKITLEGQKTEVRKKMEQLKAELKLDAKPYDLNIFEAFHSGKDAQYAVHGLIMLARETYPDPILIDKLRHLTPDFMIKIDPDSLL